MSLKDRLKQVALGAALVAAPLSYGQEKGETQADSADHERIVQQTTWDDLSIHAYHAERDKDLDKGAYTAGLDYARQINNQMAKAGVNSDDRANFVNGMMNYLVRPLSGDDEIKFGYISFYPSNLRNYWAESGSSLDFSDGLKLTLKNQTKDKNSAFILDIPQDAMTDSIRKLSKIYETLQKNGTIGQLQQSATQLSSMDTDEQKAFTDNLLKNMKNSKGDEVGRDKDAANMFMQAIPSTYTISLRDAQGNTRLAVKEDAELFYQTVVDNLMDMNKKGAINLGKIAQELYGGGLTGWGVRLFSNLLSDNQLRNMIDKSLKKPVISAFNEAVVLQETRQRDNSVMLSQLKEASTQQVATTDQPEGNTEKSSDQSTHQLDIKGMLASTDGR